MITDIDSNDADETPIPSPPSSRMKLKRSHHQYLNEPSGSEPYSSKRQVIEIDHHPNFDSSAWDNTSLVPITSDPAIANTSNRYISPLDGQCIEHCNNVSSFGLPVTHTAHGSLYTLDNNIATVKLSEPESIAQLYGEGSSRSYGTGLTYSRSQDRTVSFSQTCGESGFFASKEDVNFIRNFYDSVGTMPMSDVCGRGDGNVLSTFYPFEKGVEKSDCNIFSTSTSYSKGQGNFMSLLSCEKLPENLFTAGSNFHNESAMAFNMVSNQDRGELNNNRISHQDRTKTISFGDTQKETAVDSSVRVINSYENFCHAPVTPIDPPPYDTGPRIDALLVPKSRDSKTDKKTSANTFPTNVKSLLSTGMFDGVAVKYYSWSREKNLKGIIKGTGYLCGCDNCDLKKVLNAYEFEQHANCKTKHPNNHIYFENGKTIYGVVQELKNTPQEKLFDAIQNVTGSDINHKNFNNWKASYQVATLELQRIYGKDNVGFAS